MQTPVSSNRQTDNNTLTNYDLIEIWLLIFFVAAEVSGTSVFEVCCRALSFPTLCSVETDVGGSDAGMRSKWMAGMFMMCVSDKVHEANGCVLVHCLAGISRSPTLAIAYIMKHMRMSSDDAYRYVHWVCSPPGKHAERQVDHCFIKKNKKNSPLHLN